MPDHVLLGHADVEEAVGIALGERLERHEAEIAGQEQRSRSIRRSASSTSVRTKAPRIVARRRAPRAPAVLVVGHRPVVPLDLAFHVRDALAEVGARDAARAAARRRCRAGDRRRRARRRRGRRPRATSQPKARQRSAIGDSDEHVRSCSRAPAGRSGRRSATRLASRWCAANIAASHTEPSLHSASLTSTNDAAREPWRRAASAAPDADDRPWPSEPVEKSMPRERVLGMDAEQAAVAAVACRARSAASQPRRSSAA